MATPSGGSRVRQAPGPDNALGGVKFLFPNNYSIYFHDTPSKGGFAREKRDFSHGCIRLSEPRKRLHKTSTRDMKRLGVRSCRPAPFGPTTKFERYLQHFSNTNPAGQMTWSEPVLRV